jgi:hypothetical protein
MVEIEIDSQAVIDTVLDSCDFAAVLDHALMEYDFGDIVDSVIEDYDFSDIVSMVIDDYDIGPVVMEFLDCELDYDKIAENVSDYMEFVKEQKDDGKLDGITNEMFDLLEVIRDANRRLELLERPLWKKIYDWLKRIG